jgi:hypothetical protein
MEWKRKTGIIWLCYAVASPITIAGAFIHPSVNIAGLVILACISDFCMIDK